MTFADDDARIELLGAGACCPASSPPPAEPPEVVLRLAVRDHDRAKVDRFGKEIAPLVTTGPPGVTGFAGGRPKAPEVVAFWPALLAREEVEPRLAVTVEERLTVDPDVKLVADRARPLGRQGGWLERRRHRRLARALRAARRELTAERVKRHFAGDLPGRGRALRGAEPAALNFLLHDSLGGGGTASLVTDAQGKTHGQGLLELEVELPDSLLPDLRR